MSKYCPSRKVNVNDASFCRCSGCSFEKKESVLEKNLHVKNKLKRKKRNASYHKLCLILVSILHFVLCIRRFFNECKHRFVSKLVCINLDLWLVCLVHYEHESRALFGRLTVKILDHNIYI